MRSSPNWDSADVQFVGCTECSTIVQFTPSNGATAPQSSAGKQGESPGEGEIPDSDSAVWGERHTLRPDRTDA